MKKTLYITMIMAAAVLIGACSADGGGDVPDDAIEVSGFGVSLYDQEQAEEARAIQPFAVNDFAVNKLNQDPTRDITRLTGTGNWTLNVQVFDINGNPYPPGNATCNYSGGYWVPATTMFLPHYRTPRVNALLYPSTWNPATSVPALDQGDATKLLAQDILEQNGTNYTIIPAHQPTISLRHKHSMLDFILDGVDITQVANVEVLVGSNIYIPCKLSLGANHHEYMVILPIGTVLPQIRVTTAAGAVYLTTVRISSNTTQANHCYCIHLNGPELLLSSVTVIDWVDGTALEGSYTTPASYPTFRGQPGATVTLYYDNDLSQTFTFSSRGEETVKPAGRTIIRINELTLTTPIILDRMYVDLTQIPGLWN